MTRKEAFRTWKAQFSQAFASFKLPATDPDLKAEDYPMLPTHADPLENTEWDPAINQPLQSRLTRIVRDVLGLSLGCGT